MALWDPSTSGLCIPTGLPIALQPARPSAQSKTSGSSPRPYTQHICQPPSQPYSHPGSGAWGGEEPSLHQRKQNGRAAVSLRCGIWDVAELALPPLVPFVVNAQAGQPGYRVSLKQLLQADHTLACVFSQHIVCRGKRERGGGSVTSRQVAQSRHASRTGWKCSGHPAYAGHGGGHRSPVDLDLKALTAEIGHAFHTLIT